MPRPPDPGGGFGRAIAAALAREGRAQRARPLPVPESGVPLRRHKYAAKVTIVDGLRFASRGEARRYGELRALERAGAITDLRCQVRFPLNVSGTAVATYVADFTYREAGQLVVEDFKSPATSTDYYRLKARMFAAQYGVRIREVFARPGYTPARRTA